MADVFATAMISFHTGDMVRCPLTEEGWQNLLKMLEQGTGFILIDNGSLSSNQPPADAKRLPIHMVNIEEITRVEITPSAVGYVDRFREISRTFKRRIAN